MMTEALGDATIKQDAVRPLGSTNPSPSTWRVHDLLPALNQDAFYRRLKVLQRTSPLHRLRELVTRQSWPATRTYDPLLMAVCAVDLVMERSGLANEYDFASLLEDLTLVAEVAEPNAEPNEWSDVAEWVVRGLLGEDGRADFRVDYGDYRGDFHQNTFNWHLLRERARSDGRIIIEASVDAINALRSGLDLDVEDAQLAHETVLRVQLERGDFDGAERSADEAVRLSVELSAKLRELMETARFNLDIIDWQQEFQAKVKNSLKHVLDRIETEQNLRDHLTNGADLHDEKVRLRSFSILDKVERCLAHHRELQSLLQLAPQIFLDEQLRQVMPGRTRSRLRISVFDDLLVPALGLDLVAATGVAATFAQAALGCAVPGLLDFSEMVDRLLRPAKAESDAVVPINPFDDIVEQPSDEIAPAVLEAAIALFAQCHIAPRLLSGLLAEAPSPEVAEALRLIGLLLFDAEDLEADAGLDLAAATGVVGLVAIDATRHFDVAGYRGDDLLVGLVTLLCESAIAANEPAANDQQATPQLAVKNPRTHT